MDYLIPDAPFQSLPVIALLAIVAAGLWVLSKGADWLVEGASQLASRSGIPKIVIGATVVSLGTTAPECAVSVMAAWGGNAGLALGNAVGSVIFDTAVIFGGGCLLAVLPANRFLLNRQGWVQFGSALLLSVFCYVQYFLYGDAASVPRWAGVALLVLLAVYLWKSVVWSRQRSAAAKTEEVIEALDAHPQKNILILLAEVFIGLIGVLLGSRLVIVCVTIIAERLHIPQAVISATLVAFGTSLPELIVGFTAIRKKHPELLVGNVVGADVLNILFVTGAAALAKPLPIIDVHAAAPYVFLWLLLPAMLLMLGYFRICISISTKEGHFQRWMGAPLLIGYVVFMALSFLLGAGPTH